MIRIARKKSELLEKGCNYHFDFFIPWQMWASMGMGIILQKTVINMINLKLKINLG